MLPFAPQENTTHASLRIAWNINDYEKCFTRARRTSNAGARSRARRNDSCGIRGLGRSSDSQLLEHGVIATPVVDGDRRSLRSRALRRPRFRRPRFRRRRRSPDREGEPDHDRHETPALVVVHGEKSAQRRYRRCVLTIFRKNALSALSSSCRSAGFRLAQATSCHAHPGRCV